MILVTGGAGFAGSHLVEYLRLNGEEVEVFRGDVRDYDNCLKQVKHAETVYHLAAVTMIDETRDKPFETWDTNTRGTLNLLHGLDKGKLEKFVFASTCHIYGDNPDLPYNETTIPRPLDIYSASKYAAESICQSYYKTYNTPVVITRAFNHYGPRQRKEFLIPNIIHDISLKGETHLRNRALTRDFTYVTDIVRGYAEAGRKGLPGQVYQFCNSQEQTLEQIADEIVRQIGTGEVLYDLPIRPSDLLRSVGNHDKSTRELGWKPRVAFEEGISRTIRWIQEKLARCEN